MKAQTKQIIVLGVVVLAALGIYLGLRYVNSQPISMTSERVDLVNLTDLTQITFTGSDGVERTFVKDGEVWTFPENPDFPLDSEKIADLEQLLAGLYVTRTFEQPDILSAYGLDPVQNSITAVTSAGESTTILVGNEAEGGGNYAKVEGTDTVSIVSSALAKGMDTDLLGLAQIETLPELGEENLNTITLARGDGGALTLTKSTQTQEQEVEQETGETDEEGNPITETVTETVEVYRWALDDGTEIPEGNETLAGALDALASLEFTACTAWQPTDEQLAAAGLTSPSAILTVTCGDGEAVVRIGALNEAGDSYYAAPEGSDRIYLISASAVQAILAMDAESLTAEPAAE